MQDNTQLFYKVIVGVAIGGWGCVRVKYSVVVSKQRTPVILLLLML